MTLEAVVEAKARVVSALQKCFVFSNTLYFHVSYLCSGNGNDYFKLTYN